MLELSPLQKARLEYFPPIPELLRTLKEVCFEPVPSAHAPLPSVEGFFPHMGKVPLRRLVQGKGKPTRPYCVGVLFSGGQAPGGHNVIISLYEALKELNSESRLIGFLGGADGILHNKSRPLDAKILTSYRNQGGFDLLGTSRTKISRQEQFEAALHTVQEQKLDALVLIGGDDTNTNAVLLAEYFAVKNQPTQVLGIPKTIDGDLRSEEIEISFGFDSACKTYAELIGNVARDAISSQKYYHFIKVMGRSASHVALECALLTQPNLTLIGEEISAKNETLSQVVAEIVRLIRARKEIGKNYGVILLPEGLVDFIPDLLSTLPQEFREQLESKKDPHGNLPVSRIETEQLLISLVKKELGELHSIAHFFGYEGRSSLPSNFDATYAYALGRMAALAVRDGGTGVICAVEGLCSPVEQWRGALVPGAALMRLEERHGEQTAVIGKVYVDLKGAAFQRFASQRGGWALEDCYVNPGPIQFFGPSALVDAPPCSICLN